MSDNKILVIDYVSTNGLSGDEVASRDRSIHKIIRSYWEKAKKKPAGPLEFMGLRLARLDVRGAVSFTRLAADELTGFHQDCFGREQYLNDFRMVIYLDTNNYTDLGAMTAQIERNAVAKHYGTVHPSFIAPFAVLPEDTAPLFKKNPVYVFSHPAVQDAIIEGILYGQNALKAVPTPVCPDRDSVRPISPIDSLKF